MQNLNRFLMTILILSAKTTIFDSLARLIPSYEIFLDSEYMNTYPSLRKISELAKDAIKYLITDNDWAGSINS